MEERRPALYLIGSLSTRGKPMAIAVLMFFVLILCFAAMFGLVKFAEAVIAKPHAAPLNGAGAAKVANGVKSL